MSCLPGGLGRVSERVGVHRHAVAACIVLLLAGCGKSKVGESCSNSTEPKYIEEAGFVVYAYITVEWSDGTSSVEGSPKYCEDR